MNVAVADVVAATIKVYTRTAGMTDFAVFNRRQVGVVQMDIGCGLLNHAVLEKRILCGVCVTVVAKIQPKPAAALAIEGSKGDGTFLGAFGIEFALLRLIIPIATAITVSVSVSTDTQTLILRKAKDAARINRQTTGIAVTIAHGYVAKNAVIVCQPSMAVTHSAFPNSHGRSHVVESDAVHIGGDVDIGIFVVHTDVRVLHRAGVEVGGAGVVDVAHTVSGETIKSGLHHSGSGTVIEYDTVGGIAQITLIDIDFRTVV